MNFTGALRLAECGKHNLTIGSFNCRSEFLVPIAGRIRGKIDVEDYLGNTSLVQFVDQPLRDRETA